MTRNEFGLTWLVPNNQSLFLNPLVTIPLTTAVYGSSVLTRLGLTGNQSMAICDAGRQTFSTAGITDALRPGTLSVDITDIVPRCNATVVSASPSPGTTVVSPSPSPTRNFHNDVDNR